MAFVNCAVTAAGGGWTPVGAYPANQNDGDADTYQSWPADTLGTNDNYYDSTGLPDGAVISSVSVSGLWGPGDGNTGAAYVNFTCHLAASTTDLGSLGDVTGYGSGIAKPGGGTWTKADVASMYVRWSSLALGNNNPMKIKSSVLTVYYTLPVTSLGSVLEYL